jgi:hypothetical protein
VDTNQTVTVLNALYKGTKLANSEAWKGGAIKANLVLFLGALVSVASAFGFGVAIPPGTLEAVAGLLVTAYSLFNAYVHTATSTSVGLSPKPTARDSGRPSSGPFDIG